MREDGSGSVSAQSAHEWLLHRPGAVAAQRVIAADALGRCVLSPWHLESLGTLVTSQASSRMGQRSCRRGSDRKTSGAAWLLARRRLRVEALRDDKAGLVEAVRARDRRQQ